MFSVIKYLFTFVLLLGLFKFSVCLHLTGTWKTDDFFVFLTKFGFQQTDLNDKVNTQGYIYGNITSKTNPSTPLTLTVVDAAYFLQFYGNRTKEPYSEACPSMFNQIQTIAWDAKCYRSGQEDFLRRIPCEQGKLCLDEDTPDRIVPGHQFTYAVQDTKQPR